MAYEPDPREWEQKEWLYEQYWGKMRSTAEIAKNVDVARTTIRKEIYEAGIPTRITGYTDTNTVSPFAGFYGSDVAGRSDSKSRQVYEEDYEEESRPNWADIAEDDEAVGEAAQWE